MKWAVLLGSPDISGGTYVIYEHMLRAMRNGVDVTIITESNVAKNQLNWHPEAASLRWTTFDLVRREQFDVALATWWRTAYELSRISARSYAYFVQSIESRFYDGESNAALRLLVDGTYTLPLKVITEASWIAGHLRKYFGTEAHVVKNGIRKDIYTVNGPSHADRAHRRLRVLVEGPLNVAFKNVERTIALCRRSMADEVWLLTSTRVNSIRGIDRVFSQIPILDTPKVYRSCDVLVKLSYVEGMFGPPLEMFHCGGTAIVYDVTGHDEYIVGGHNSIVIRRDDETGVVEAINELRRSPNLLSQLKMGAVATASEWPSWEWSAHKFRSALNEIAQSEAVSAEELGAKGKLLFGFYELAEKYRAKNTEFSRTKYILKTAREKLRVRLPRIYSVLSGVKWWLKIRSKKRAV